VSELPPQPINANRADHPYEQAIWIGLLVLILSGGWYLWASQPVYHRPNEHDGPPPNWGNPPLYPGAQSVVTETGKPCLTSATKLIMPVIKGRFAPTKEISFYVAAPPDTVAEWYRSRFTAESWDYDTQIDVGDLSPHYITAGFWHYGWKMNAPEFGPRYVMDIQTGTTHTGLTSVNILLGDGYEDCWAGQ
jgi:hypothetical protein